VILRTKRVRPGAAGLFYASRGAAGLDLSAALPQPVRGGEDYLCVQPGERVLVPTGWALEIPDGYEGQVRPRSGLAYRQGLVAVLGTIDSDYRGEVFVHVTNIGTAPQFVKSGERIAQLVIAPVARVGIVESGELSETTRGEKGFGSTG
jgi:dUTP diphosphatase